jgi:hypothetical protein
MQPGGLFAVCVPPALSRSSASNPSSSYGPFNYGGGFTTESNRRFDGWLKGRNAASGIRDFEAVRDVAAKVGGEGGGGGGGGGGVVAVKRWVGGQGFFVTH